MPHFPARFLINTELEEASAEPIHAVELEGA
jgi:hypothetical protein